MARIQWMKVQYNKMEKLNKKGRVDLFFTVR